MPSLDASTGPRQVVERPVRFGIAELSQNLLRPTLWAVAVDGVVQSFVDLADPAHFTMPYAQWIAEVVDRQWPDGVPVSAVHVGGAGCTVPRYVAATRPGSDQTVFELDGPLVDLVREYLDLDAVRGLRMQVRDGRAGIIEMAESSTDLVVIDVFRAGDAVTEFTTVEFLREIARVLRPGGVYATNVWGAGDLGFALRVAASADAVFPHVLTFAEAGVLMKLRPGNIVVVASTGELPAADLVERTKSRDEHHFCLTPAQLTAVCGPAAPLTETDPLVGPLPTVNQWGRGLRTT